MAEYVKHFFLLFAGICITLGLMVIVGNVLAALYSFAGFLLAIPAGITFLAAFLAAISHWEK